MLMALFILSDKTPEIGWRRFLPSCYEEKDNIVVYESTVYPGTTEYECLPILEDESGLKCGIFGGLKTRENPL